MGKTIQVSGFPSHVNAETAQAFLERHTGHGTVVALKIRQFKSGGSRAYAIVQFTSKNDAEHILSLARTSLWYGSNYLKARLMDNDIVPKPRAYQHSMEDISLLFGCQISKDKFFVLWEGVNVSTKFGFGLRKLYFFVVHHGVEYRLELSYESIWQMELRRPHDDHMKYLLIQLFEVPRIFQKTVSSSGLVFDSPIFNYFKETQDDQWVRTTDFTQSCGIGQSSVLCLMLPYGCKLPNFRENFAYFQENNGPFELQQGTPFSYRSELVPIVVPPASVNIPYDILFKISFLIQNGCLAWPSLDLPFFRLVDPLRMNKAFIEYALEKLYYLKECCYDPVRWLTDEYRKYNSSRRRPQQPSIMLDDGLVYVRRVQITPCKVYFCGPEVNVSNRVLRHYPDDIDNFIRVSFVDENLEKLHSMDLSPRVSSGIEASRTGIDRRIRSVLRNGIVIGDKKFEFLAFSSSQLRDNSAWMFASRPGLSATAIRRWMGDFSSIKNVAKYAARLGQSFGSSVETLSVAKDEVERIPDIEVKNGANMYVFSDGIGKISADFARKVTQKYGIKGPNPSAFQIRYGGFKGVVAVDPTSSKKLSLRDSMCKYQSDNTKLDVLAYSKYQPCYLNRQLITLLSTLGVRDSAFERKQTEAMDQLDSILKNPLSAQEALELMCPGEMTNILKEMLICGYKPDTEPFLAMMLQTFRASKLEELRTKTRIFVPRGRQMMGCLDETRTLEYGEVFVQVTGSRFRSCGNELLRFSGSSVEPYDNRVVKGKVVVAKNPCLHPGDVRVLNAVDVPALRHMVDCVVFPQKGNRPHTNECSGSDLDGDIYFVCWDSELIPPRYIQPMDYTPAETVKLNREVTIEDVEEYFADYIINDSLGIIANAHTVFADRERDKAMSTPCVELAKLFSIAVDFPKTGVPAEIPPKLHVKEYPDFMDKPDKPSYVSQNVIGKLFREVKERAPSTNFVKSFTFTDAKRSYDRDMEYDGFEDYLDDASYYKGQYDFKLGNLMDYYGIKTEAEILSGNVMKMSKSFSRRNDAEAIRMAVRSLRKEARTCFSEGITDTGSESDDMYAKASAWYHVTYHPNYLGSYNEGLNRDHFLSFPWCVYDKLMRIKKENASIRRACDMSSLEHHFRYGFSVR